MPRLLQRVRATPSGRPADADDAPLRLPRYESPVYPMDDNTKQKIITMSSSRDFDTTRRTYEKHLAKSSTHLFESVGSINDVLFARKRSLAHMAEKRRARGIEEKPDGEVELEKYVAELEATITEMTDSSEEALRQVIDCRAELEDQPAVLEMVVEGLNAQQPNKRAARRAAGSDDDGDEHETADSAEEEAEDLPPMRGVKELLKSARKAKLSEYGQLTPYQRYALNNNYISFKKNWHDALHPEDQIPLPDPSTWFDDAGRPTKGVVADAAADDDLVVEREIIDLKCPLSLQTMKEPYSNHRCRHTFEKTAIMEFIRSNNGMAKCPVCSEDLRIKDLYLDEVVLRKIKRAEQAARRGVDDISDIEAEQDGDSNVIIGRASNMKNEKRPRQMEEIEEN
ncbi:hypothetical protein BT67DRAFT_441351 [Trichocladium antarcticum]|uniref:peptidylprolyl isomerase n=1 Tax=Trichocladium antarcticum TaxID=1450529 RepID=A0AAN6ULF7_9PEZI|nr:hypothetical protein BT67DRAFT_441351 [Trichocladium antarcticum]